jgi:hypothetical protein
MPGAEKSWDWRSGKEGELKFQGWGPVLLKGPNGEQPGNVIVMVELMMGRTTSIERDIIPGLGISREIIVREIGQEVTLMHQEYVLTGVPTISDTDGSDSPGSEKP